MRYEAHLKAMQALEVLGYAEARPLRSRPREVRWFLTAAGRGLLEALGTGEPED
jgi:DNA-binding HxlR family transcriptional regulator